MEGGKKIAVIVILLGIIIGTGVYLGKKKFGGVQMPPYVAERPVEKIDVSDGTLMTLQLQEWRALGAKDGKWKNPETNKYTMVTPIECVACGKKVIPVDLPKSPELSEDEHESMKQMQAYNDEVEKLEDEYKCPKCGKFAYEY